MPDDLFNTLQDREARIEQAERDSYHVRGGELAAIRDKELYRERYQTFEAYCDERWELGRTHVYYLTEAARFAFTLVNVPVPARETHVRPLLKLDSDGYRIEVWREVLDEVGGNPRNVKAAIVENAVDRFITKNKRPYVILDEWNGMSTDEQLTVLSERVGNEGLNQQKNADIEWADWSWNPVTGCLHGCPYCYARNIAFSVYPAEVGFGATLWPNRLKAPIDRQPTGDGAKKNIFVCSMADLFGRWVPARWIEAVLDTVRQSPQWNFLFLTKFPNRMSEFDIPDNAWLGTTVDLQARVANAEKAFSTVQAPVRWLSLEPMLEPLRFSNLHFFDWIVIGGASETRAVDGTPATPAWSVPIDWIVDIHAQAREAGCAVYYKTNSGLVGTTRLREYPGSECRNAVAPPVFDYLKAVPKAEQIG